MAEPQALILYGDAGQALYYDDKNPTTNREGTRVQPILVAPSQELKLKYNLVDEDLPIMTDDGRRAIWMEYPIKQIDWLSKSKTGAVLFVWCAFDGSKTPIMRKMDELLEWDTHRDKTESRLRAQVSALQREMEDLTSNLVEVLRRNRELEDAVLAKDEETGEEQGG